jgi:hypothetical protein
MTHNELLTKITTEMFQFKKGGFSRAYMQALRAIVELHKCSNPRFDLLCDCGKAYPCPTIQAIEKELK